MSAIDQSMGRRGAHRGEPILDRRPCSNCGYDLRGLFTGGNCPECGHVIGVSAATSRYRSLGDAPRGYLILLMLGLLTMTISGFCRAGWAVVGAFIIGSPYVYGGVLLALNILWLMGVLLILRERPLKPTTRSLPAGREWWRLRLAVAISQACTIPAVIAKAAADVSGAVWLNYVAFAFAAVAAVGLVALCIYLSYLAEWSSDEHLVDQFRNTGWFLGLFALLTALVVVTPAAGMGTLVKAFGSLAVVGLFFASVYMLVLILQMVGMVRWAMVNAGEAYERDLRRAERMRREEEARIGRLRPPPSLAEQAAANAAAARAGLEDGSGAPPESEQRIRFTDEVVIEPTHDDPYGLEDGEPGAGPPREQH